MTLEMRRCLYPTMLTISPRLHATIDGAIEAARSESVAEIRSAESTAGSSRASAKVLGILPIPICLLPDENVSRALCG